MVGHGGAWVKTAAGVGGAAVIWLAPLTPWTLALLAVLAALLCGQ